MTGFYRYMLLLLGFFSMTKKTDGVQVNAARSGTTSQSTTNSGWPSQNAIDGLKSSCTHTLAQANPWWRVDLQKTLSVDRVVITNRPDCCAERINGAQIRVGHISDINSNPVCSVIPSIPAGAAYTFSCGGMVGRYVYVVIPSASSVLTLCEVEVYGDLPGLWIKRSFVRIEFKSSASLTDSALRVDLLTQLQSALATRGISEVMLQWSQMPRKDKRQNQDVKRKCP